jgi:LysR family transcriptional regulator, nitrogen assimilation regulatory protein
VNIRYLILDHPLDLKQLEYFRHVAELGSFTNAAAFLSVGQPTLSRQIAELELEFGQDLFDRNGRGVVLTQAGSQLLEHTRGILMQVGRARQELETTRSGDAGHITLGLPASLGNIVTVPLIKAFGKLLPKSRLAFSEGLSAYILERLSVGRIDCALAYNATASEDFDVAPLLDDQLFLIAPASRSKKTSPSISLSELADYPLVIPGRPHANRMTVEHALSTVGKKIQIAHEVECIQAIVDLVRQGHGFGVLSLNAITSSPWAAHVSIKPILNPTLMFPLSLVTSTRRPKSPFMRKALSLIGTIVREEIGQNLAKLPRNRRVR